MAVGRAGALVLLIALVLASAAPAQDADDESNPVAVRTQDAQAFAAGGPAEQLLERVRRQGTVRVIVGLRLPPRIEPQMAPAQVAEHRQRQRVVESAVLGRVFGSPTPSGVVRYDVIPYMSVLVTAEEARRLLADPDVVFVREDRGSRPQLAESVPLIHATDIQSKRADGRGRVVAVLDTGVDRTHPMFAGRRTGAKIVHEACFSTNGGVFQSFCPHQFDVAIGKGTAKPCRLPGCDHGTHVASIAAGHVEGADVVGDLDGVAPKADIIAMQVFSRKTTEPARKAVRNQDTDLLKALQYVVQLSNEEAFIGRIAAVNMSLGGGKWPNACDATYPDINQFVDILRFIGIPIIVSSGNDGFASHVSFPACISGVIPVGNVIGGGSDLSYEMLAESSNNSSLVRLAAPGSGILAAVPPRSACIGEDGAPYCEKTGTSMAAPHVAGAFAALKGAFPDKSIDDIRRALECTGRPIHYRFKPGANPPFVELLSYTRRIDLLGAYNHLKKPDRTTRRWTFSSASDAADWTPIRGEWTVQDGAYVEGGAQTLRYVAAYVPHCDDNFTLTARFNLDLATNTIGGVIIKGNANVVEQKVTGYDFGFGALHFEGNIFRIAELRQVFNYSLGSLSGVEGSFCFTQEAVVNAGANMLSIRARGRKLTFSLNGVKICDYEVDPLGYHERGAIIVYGSNQNPPALDELSYTSQADIAPLEDD